MKREDALSLLHTHVKNEKMIIHCLSSEAVMRALARHFGEDEDRWGLAGLLHDLDVEITHADLKVHGLESVRLLQEAGFDDELIEAIKRHNEDAHNDKRETLLQHALAAGETITGLIYATALVYPDKKIGSVKVKSVVKRMKEKAFAASVNRDIIMECEKTGLSLDQFTTLALGAMQEISDNIGL